MCFQAGQRWANADRSRINTVRSLHGCRTQPEIWEIFRFQAFHQRETWNHCLDTDVSDQFCAFTSRAFTKYLSTHGSYSSILLIPDQRLFLYCIPIPASWLHHQINSYQHSPSHHLRRRLLHQRRLVSSHYRHLS